MPDLSSGVRLYVAPPAGPTVTVDPPDTPSLHLVPVVGTPGATSTVTPPIAVTSDTIAGPGDELWVTAPAGVQVQITIVREPAGKHCRVKLMPQSGGTVLVVPVSGLIDGSPSYLMTVPGQANEFSSNGTDFALF